ncbi:hypothetical protein N7475_006243 [Penicillium sp. IBT 31633x]|nr:hypothetical protein N7475_006243 [Penicillium sp. IBT 31633x]
MLFLSLPRSYMYVLQRSPSVDEEDRFCNFKRQTGAILWPSKEDRIEALVGSREMMEGKEKALAFVWSTDRVGVWG